MHNFYELIHRNIDTYVYRLYIWLGSFYITIFSETKKLMELIMLYFRAQLDTCSLNVRKMFYLKKNVLVD